MPSTGITQGNPGRGQTSGGSKWVPAGTCGRSGVSPRCVLKDRTQPLATRCHDRISLPLLCSDRVEETLPASPGTRSHLWRPATCLPRCGSMGPDSRTKFTLDHCALALDGLGHRRSSLLRSWNRSGSDGTRQGALCFAQAVSRSLLGESSDHWTRGSPAEDTRRLGVQGRLVAPTRGSRAETFCCLLVPRVDLTNHRRSRGSPRCSVSAGKNVAAAVAPRRSPRKSLAMISEVDATRRSHRAGVAPTSGSRALRAAQYRGGRTRRR